MLLPHYVQQVVSNVCLLGVGLHRRSTRHIRARVCARMLHSQNMPSFFAMCFSHNAARMLRVRCVLCMRACACVCMVRVFCMKGRLPCLYV